MNPILKTFLISVLFSFIVAFVSCLVLFLHESYISYGSIRIVNFSSVMYFVIQYSFLVVLQLIILSFLVGIFLNKFKIRPSKQAIIYAFLALIYFIGINYYIDFRLIVINPT